MSDEDEVGVAFCRALSILSENNNPEPCNTAWVKAKNKEISQELMNEYLEDTYGEGLPHKTKEVILAVIQQGNNGSE